MKLTLLCDNNTIIDQYYLGEPGFSCLLEIDDARILLDTGYSDVFLRNAETAGIDLNHLTHVVLSHGHNDHTRGLTPLTERCALSQTRLVCHPRCLLPRWYGQEYIGPPGGILPHFGFYNPSSDPVWLTENCVFLGQIPTIHSFEPRYAIGTMEMEGQTEPDFLLDDSALACKTPKGLFIITGCSHSGICNIVSYAQSICGEVRIAGIIGGFHLLEANERVEKTAEFLKGVNPAALYPCHCVSLAAKIILSRALDIQEVGSGTVIEA